MSWLTLFETAPSGAALLGFTVFGAALQLVTALLAARAARRDAEMAEELRRLAEEGHPQRARILAREASATLAPMLAALSGDVESAPTPPRRTLIAAGAMALPAGLLVGAIFLPLPPLTRLAAAAAASALVPFALVTGRCVVIFHGYCQRRVRAACASLLEDNARAELERERAAAFRRNREAASA